jgi:DNA polymerase-4/protein ImuB
MLTGFECLLFKVFAALGPKNMGINRLDIWTHTLSGECLEKSIFFKTPAMQLKTALDRIGQVFETWPQPAPVCEIGIKVTGLGRPAGRQKSLIGEVRSTDNLLGDIHQLELKLGGPQLFKFKEAEPWSRIPERRHVLTPLSW